MICGAVPESATTLLTPACGSLRNAKSRCGSHRDETLLGSKPPIEPANDRPRVNDLLRIELHRVSQLRTLIIDREEQICVKAHLAF